MRPIILMAIVILVGAGAFYDLNVGTIPKTSNNAELISDQTTSPQQAGHENQGKISLPYQEVIVEQGHTVYGIVKALHGEHFTIPAHIVVEDFEALNPSVNAHEILIGQAYRFPLYETDSTQE